MSAVRQLRLVSATERPHEPLPFADSKQPMLRPYQQRIVVDVARHWAAGNGRVLVVAPTGSGKTHLACALLQAIERKGRRALFLVHRDVLIDQAGESLARWGIEYGHIKAGYRENRGALIQIGSVQSLARRSWWSETMAGETQPVTLFLDECHTTGWATVVRDILEDHPAMRVCGLTATPFRLKKTEGLGDIFDAACCAPFPADLIADGFLTPPVYYGSAKVPDLSSVRTRAGDYVEEDLERVCDTAEMVGALIDDWQKIAAFRRTIAFPTTVLHAHHIAAECERRGIRAVAISAETPLPERKERYEALRGGRLHLIASVGCLTEGFDVPEISAVLLARPTKSKALHLQQIGRGLRIAPWVAKEDCIVIDQAQNTSRFGFAEDFASYTLRGGRPGVAPIAAQPEGEEDPENTTKQCPQCQAIVKRLAPRCPCGYLWPLPKSAAPRHAAALVRRELPVEDRVLAYRDLLREAYLREYKPESAAMRYRDAFGQWPERTWVRGAAMGLHPDAGDATAYRLYLEDVAAAKEIEDTGTWIGKWMTAELGQAAELVAGEEGQE